jgi:hypothetical protein
MIASRVHINLEDGARLTLCYKFQYHQGSATLRWFPVISQKMQIAQSPSRSRQFRGVILAIFCVFLIAFSATTQVLHHHGLSNDPHPDCAACVASHAGLFFSAPFEMPLVTEHVEAVEADRLENPLSSFVFSFYSRPPPAETASL